MAIRVALNHKTAYTYDRPVSLGPHVVRLRPAPHCRTPVHSYSIKVCAGGALHQLAAGSARQLPPRPYVFEKPASELSIEVDLIADMTVINPFDFFVEESAEMFPFSYDPWLANELKPFLEAVDPLPRFAAFLAGIDRTPIKTVDMLVALNQRLQHDVRYLIRMESGVQTPEETLTPGQVLPGHGPGCSCRCCDTSAWRRASCRAT